MTTQARELAAILRDLGFRTRRVGGIADGDAIHVRTLGDGRKGFGEAYAIIYSTDANERVAEQARALADRGCHVTRYERDGKLVHVSVALGHGRPGRVDRYDLDAESRETLPA